MEQIEPAEIEALLIEQAAKGDAQSFARLYDLNVDRVYRHIFYRVSDIGVAEDLTQEVFLKGWQALHRYKRTGSPFVAWLLTIAHNLVIDHYRARKRETSLEASILPSDSATTPQQIAEVRWEQRELERAIMQLRPEQQLVIVLRFIDGFEYSEIAALLRKSEGAVRVIQHRALKELRRILGKEIG
ncbi:MAG: sigma-70 family RNA polymerase sigma factor [Dehalococcoidia bacterium]|nr:MAG: sigma-70 family RNA polymerase sigma factor [Dehalococcoidia bacterium]